MPKPQAVMASFLQDDRGRLRDSEGKMESAKSELRSDVERLQVSRLSICQNPKLQLWADTREVLDISYTYSCVSMIPPCQLIESWE